MFKVMEIAKEKFQVQYNIGQTSLEQVGNREQVVNV